MGKQALFMVLPAMVYGVAVVDLLKIFRHKNNYWEMLGWGIMLMMYIVIIWLELWSKMEIVATNKWFFMLLIGHAILLSQTSHVLTPEAEDNDTEKYFYTNRKKFFVLTTLMVVLNMVIQEFFYDDQRPWFFRLSLVLVCIICVVVNKVWVRTLSLAIVLSLLIGLIIKLP